MRPKTFDPSELELDPLDRDEYDDPLDRELELDDRELLLPEDREPPLNVPPPPGLAAAIDAFEIVHAKTPRKANPHAHRNRFMWTARRAAR
jgi:hypothetical protein